MAGSRPRASSWFRRDDAEMAKKHDEPVLPQQQRYMQQWQTRQSIRAPRRGLVCRMILYAVILLCGFMLGARLLGGGVPSSHGMSWDAITIEKSVPSQISDSPDTKSNSDAEEAPAPQKQGTYDGRIRFPELGRSLRSLTITTEGSLQQNRNVMFAAASLKSVAKLLPIACAMSLEKENYVHFAVMSRTDLPVKQLLKINGIDQKCEPLLHDARPDMAVSSTDKRLKLAASSSIYHINTFLHPQALIVDSTSSEEQYFLTGVREQIGNTKIELIELPENPDLHIPWLAKLDSAALSAWNKVHFDILIHAPPQGSGNMRRLLSSLQKADLASISTPHVIIELPNAVNAALERTVDDFRWPPPQPSAAARPSMLTLRHRITRQKLSLEESSVRLLESFWPTSPEHQHVLLLSPHAEVGTQFFNYLKYILLHYRYSNGAHAQDWKDHVMGLGFAAPDTQLDGKKTFVKPLPKKTTKAEDTSIEAPFVWQGPNSDAMLFMGDKWVELHGLVSQTLDFEAHAPAPAPILATKSVDRKYPAWLEHAVRLARLRGYVTVYPGKATSDAILGIHNDLLVVPEEYQGDAAGGESKEWSGDSSGRNFDANSQVDILSTLPNNGVLPTLSDHSVLSWDGETIDLTALAKSALAYAKTFRREVGQCSEKKLYQDPDRQAKDLFCKAEEGEDTKKMEKVEKVGGP